MPIAQTAKQQAINAAKIIARESNELLKSAGEQIMPAPEKPKSNSDSSHNTSSTEDVKPTKSLSFLNEYKGELEQIRKENLFKQLQAKIASGEEVSLESYANELGYQEREVLQAQMAAVKMRREAENKKPDTLPQIASKKARGMITGMIKKRNQQPVETRQPPSS